MMNRTYNTTRNIIWGGVNKILSMLCPFLVRTIIIQRLGVEYLGLNSLFTSILNVLSLAELGFDSAVVFIMYKSVAEKDKDELSVLLNFMKKVYVVVGFVVLGIGLSLCPILNYLISDEQSIPSDINIYYIYIIFLVNTVISYFFGGYRNSIINAYHRQDVISNINSVVLLISSVVQIILLYFTKSYYLYLYTLPLFTIINNVYKVFVSKRMYPEIEPKGRISDTKKQEIKKLIKGTFLSKLGTVLSVSLDNIVISAALGLVVLAYYSNYSYIITAIQGFLVIIYSSMQAGFGNSAVVETKEKNYDNLMKFSFAFNWILGCCFVFLVCLFQPFVFWWVGSDAVLPEIIMILICLNFYFTLSDSILGTYKAALGIWWEDRYRCLIGGIANFLVNILMVLILKQYGEHYALAGIVVSTILSQLVIQKPWAIVVTFKQYFLDGMKQYFVLSIKNFLVTILSVIICYVVCTFIPFRDGLIGILLLIVRLLICAAISNFIYYIVYKKDKYFGEMKIFLFSHFKK